MTDIEDLDNRPCVVCPWHNYKIMLDTGECVYAPVFHPRQSVPEEDRRHKSRGLRQRIHDVRVRGDDVQVRIRTDPPARQSDYYSSQEYRDLIKGVRRMLPPSAKVAEPTSSAGSTSGPAEASTTAASAPSTPLSSSNPA